MRYSIIHLFWVYNHFWVYSESYETIIAVGFTIFSSLLLGKYHTCYQFLPHPLCSFYLREQVIYAVFILDISYKWSFLKSHTLWLDFLSLSITSLRFILALYIRTTSFQEVFHYYFSLLHYSIRIFLIIPLDRCNALYLSTYQSIDQVASTLWLLWTMLLWTFACHFLGIYVLIYLGCIINNGIGRLYMITLCLTIWVTDRLFSKESFIS